MHNLLGPVAEWDGRALTTCYIWQMWFMVYECDVEIVLCLGLHQHRYWSNRDGLKTCLTSSTYVCIFMYSLGQLWYWMYITNLWINNSSDYFCSAYSSQRQGLINGLIPFGFTLFFDLYVGLVYLIISILSIFKWYDYFIS